MTITNDPQVETPFVLKERRPFSMLLVLEKQDKSRVDVTGCQAALTIADTVRKGGDLKIENVGAIVSGPDGTFRFDIAGEDLNFGAGTYDMAIRLTTAEDFTSSIIEGPLELTHNPDTVIPPLPEYAVPPLSLTARLLTQNRVTVKVNHHPDSVLLDAAARAENASSSAGISADEAAASAAAAAASEAGASAARDQAQVIADSIDIDTTELAAAVASATASKNAAATSAAAAATSATNAATSATNSEASALASESRATDSEAAATAAEAAQSGAEIVRDATQTIYDNVLELADEFVQSTNIRHMVKISQLGYDEIITPDPETLYVIVG